MKTGIKASSWYNGYPTELYGGNNGAAAVLYRSGSPNSLLVLNSSTPFDWTSTERTNKALNWFYLCVQRLTQPPRQVAPSTVR